MSKAINIFLSLKPAFKIRTALNEIIRNRFLFNINELLLKQLETINKDDIINSLTIFKNMKIHIV